MAMLKWEDIDDNKIFYTTYLEALIQCFDQNRFVRSGCAVTEQSPNSMKVDIASGNVYYNGSDYSLSADTLSLSSSETGKDRVDVIVWDYNGGSDQFKLKTGDTWATYGSTEFPLSRRLDADEVPIAYVIVGSAASSIANTDIYDVRLNQGNDNYNLSIGGSVVVDSSRNADVTSLQIGSTEVIDSSRNLKNIAGVTTSFGNFSTGSAINFVDSLQVGGYPFAHGGFREPQCISDWFFSRDAYKESTSGSGSIAYTTDKDAVKLDTGGTSSSTAVIQKYISGLYIPSFGYYSVWKVRLKDVGAATDQSIYLTWGGKDTDDHVGFKIVDGAIYGTMADGTTQETTADLASELRYGLDGYPHVLTLYYDGVNGKAYFYIDSEIDTLANADATLETNSPNTNNDIVFYGRIGNSAAASKTVELGGWELYSSPVAIK